MSKLDRIPITAWPALLSDEMAARYLDLSLSMFRQLVKKKALPQGRNVFKTSCIRWRRVELDDAISRDAGDPVSYAVETDGSEWVEALN